MHPIDPCIIRMHTNHTKRSRKKLEKADMFKNVDKAYTTQQNYEVSIYRILASPRVNDEVQNVQYLI